MWSESNSLMSRHDMAAVRKLASRAWGRVQTWRGRRLGLRGSLLYVAAVPLLPAAVIALAGGRLVSAVTLSLAFAMVIAGARLNRRGLLERLLAPERRYTRATRLPYQYLAVLLVAAATGLAAYVGVGHDLPVSVTYALLAALGFHLAYRLPAPATVLGSGPAPVSDPAARRALQQAEQQLLAIEQAALEIGHRELQQRLQRIAALGRAVLDMLAQRPADLFRARQFLHVHLEGAERVARRYARSHPLSRGQQLEARFRDVLAQIESAFARQRQQLLEHDLLDLDVQIEVLRRQLQREGIS
jgi:hypothetical protein